MESSEQTGFYIYPPICTNGRIFAKGAFFHLVLSEYIYANQSHDFTNLNFCDVTLLSAIALDRAQSHKVVTSIVFSPLTW